MSLGLLQPNVEIGPSAILSILATSLILQNCSHGSKSGRIPSNDDICRYTSPIKPLGFDEIGEQGDGKIGVVAVNGNNSLRTLALAFRGITPNNFNVSIIPFVLRGGACLQCALEICQKLDCSAVIC